MRKDFGWDYLHNDDMRDVDFSDDDGSWENKSSDGGSTYYGADGSWGYKNADGSASYYGADGSWGYKNADGSGSYYGADGSWGYKNDDGSGSYHDADGGSDYMNADGSSSYYGPDGSWGYRNPDGSSMYFEGSNTKNNDAQEEDYYNNDDADEYGEDEYEEDEYDKEYDEEYDEDEDDDDESYSYSSNSYTSSYTYTTTRRTFAEWWRDFLHKLKIFGICVLILAILIGAGIIWYKADAHFSGIPIGVQSSKLSDYKYEDLKNKLTDAGFKFVSCTYVEDLEYNEGDKIDFVEKMTVGEDSSFDSDDEYSRFSKIEITYHRMKRGSIPMSYKEAKEQNYKDVEKAFRDAGFGNVEIEAEYDIVIGLFDKENEVETVYVNDNKKFDSGSRYDVDTPIKIVYHRNKKDKPE